MARISNKQVYKIVEPTASDYVIGTDAEDLNKTKTFTMQGIADFVGGNVTVGVGSLNGLVGAVTLSAGVGLVLTENGNDLTLSLQTPDFVESVNGLDGVLNVQGSTNIGVTDNGTDTITLTALNVAKTNEANTFTNDQTLNRSLSVAGGVFDVDFDTQRVGVNNPTPLYPLDIIGDTNITGTTGDVLTLNSPSEVGENYILFNNSLGTDKGWVGYRGASDVLQLRSLLGSVNIIADTSVTLSYGGVTRLETTGSGVEITGDLTVGDVTASSIIITGGASSDFLKADGSLDGTTYQDVTERGQADGYAPLNSLSKIENTFLPNDLERTTNKGAANGYAPLDSGAKIPLVNIPDSVLGQVTYEGTWDANNNLPLLTNPPAADTKGDYYVCSSSGTQFGITFQTGDWIISNGTAWEKVDNTDAVTSVFGRLGNIIALESDYDSFYATLLGNNFFDAGTITFNDGLRTNRGLKVNPNRLLPSGNNKDFTIDSISGTNIFSSGQNYFGFNDDNNIFFQKDNNVGGKGGQLEWNNTADRAYTLPDASGTFAFTNLDNNFSVDQTFQGNIDGQQASFTNNGIVGVLALDVLGDSRFIVGDFHVGQNASSPDLFVDRVTKNTGLGTFNPSAKLDVVGTTELNGNTTINGDLNIDGGKITIDTTAIVGREDILLSTVSDTSLSKFGIANGTTVSTEFTPQFYGYQHVDRQALIFSGYGNAAYDLITSDPLVSFVVSNTNNSTNPLAGALTSINQRDPFAFSTTTFDYIRVKANGYIGLGNNTSPTEMLDVTGNVKATSFIGSGASLTSLNASNITTGTLADARLSSNVALKDIDNNFSVGQTIGGNTTINGNLASDNVTASTGRFYAGGKYFVFGTATNDGWIEYANDTDMNFYTDAANRLKLGASGNVLQGNTTINGNLSVSNSTTQIIKWSRDASVEGVLYSDGGGAAVTTSTGLFDEALYLRPANSDVRMYAGGSNIQTWTSGNTTINGVLTVDTSTNRMLRLDGDFATGGFTTQSIYRQGVEMWREILGGNNEFIIRSEEAGSNERFAILQNGNVGIGTSSILSEAKLTVVGGRTYLDAPNEFTLRLSNSGTVGGYIGTSAVNTLSFYNSTGVERMRIDSSGNLAVDTDTLFVDATNNRVGIGTSNPQRSLHVSGSAGQLRLEGSSVGSYIEFVSPTSTSYIGHPASVTSGSTDDLLFFVSGSERMRIDSSGNVGIGTALPAYPLTVKSSGVTGIKLLHGNDSTTFQIDSFGTTGTDAGALIRMFNEAGDTTVNIDARSGASRDTYFNQGGNFGIGTDSPSAKLQLKMANDSILSFTGIGSLSSGIRCSGSIGFESDFNFVFRDEDGSNERMRIDSSGNVTISGSLSKGSGSFKIDHPLPEKKDTHHLVHSFVEAPQADNIYRGKIDLVDGKATVNLDEAGRMTEGTFVLLNGNIQCFTSNESGWTAIRGKVEGNTLTIEAQDAECTDTVSWLVIGERIDQHMIDTEWTDENGRVITEPLKQVEPAPDEEEITE